MRNTPAGPFLRITDGELNLPAADDFTIEGSIFVSPSLIDGTVSMTPFGLPLGAATKYVEFGASDWNFHFETGEYRLSAGPPDVTVLGTQIAPDGTIDIDLQNTGYSLGLTLEDDFEPYETSHEGEDQTTDKSTKEQAANPQK